MACCKDKNCCSCVDSADCDRGVPEVLAQAERDLENDRYKVQNNIVALWQYLASMNCAVDKAEKGSTVEDMYFLEKLEKMCNRLGFDLVKK